MSVVLGVDIGTTKLAAVAWDTQTGCVVAIASAPNPGVLPRLPAGRHEQDPEQIYNTCVGLCRELAENPACPWQTWDSIAFTGQMHGVLLADAGLRALTPLITWCDQRSAELVAGIERECWPAERTGCYLHAGYGGATLAVLGGVERTCRDAKALTIADFVAQRMCGGSAVRSTDVTHAASWGLLDVHQREWDQTAVQKLGISPDLLPVVHSQPGAIGMLAGPAASAIGATSGVSVRIMLPIGDNQASFYGTCGFENEALLLNLGTGGQISLPVAGYRYSGAFETRPLPFGGYLLVGASLCGGRAYASLKEFFRVTLQEFGVHVSDGDALYGVMNRLAEQALDRQELVVDTRMAGTRMNPALRGSIGNIGVENLTPGALSLGFIRGMVRELTQLPEREDIRTFQLAYVGGNALRRNPLAMRIAHEELGLPCVPAQSVEEAATGAALAGLRTEGML